MTAPILLPAGDSTPGRLWTVDVNTQYDAGTINWVTAQYVESVDFNPDDAAMVDATITGDGGFSGQDKLGAAWSCTLNFNRMIKAQSNPPVYDVVQEYLRIKAIGKFSRANRVQVRVYEFDVNDIAGVITPRVEAYMGYANVQWPGTGAVGQAEARKVACALMGKGKLNPIAHPYPAVAGVPVITDVAPSSIPAAGGTNVRILGSGFTGTVVTTGVKFGGTNATSWTVISDNEIVATAPAHATGTGLPVVVANAAGSSSGGPTVSYV